MSHHPMKKQQTVDQVHGKKVFHDQSAEDVISTLGANH